MWLLVVLVGVGVDVVVFFGCCVMFGDFMDDLLVGVLYWFVVWVIGIGLFFDMYEIFFVSMIGFVL